METGFMNRIIGLVLALVVGGLLVGGLLIPTVEGTQTTLMEKEYTNTEYTHTMDLIKDDVLIEIDYTNGAGSIDVMFGDKEYLVDVSQQNTISTWLFYSDVCMLWVDRVAGVNSPVYALKSTNYTGSLSGASSVFTYDHSTKEVKLSINGTETFTDTVEKFAYVYTANEGEYGYFTTNVTVSENATIEMFRGGGWWDNTYVTYSATGKQWYNSTTTPIEGLVISKDATPTEYAAEYSSTHWVDNGNKTYSRDSASTTCTYNDGADDVTNTPAMRIIAPIKYVAYESNSYSIMLGVVGILAIVALVVVAANGIRNKY